MEIYRLKRESEKKAVESCNLKMFYKHVNNRLNLKPTIISMLSNSGTPTNDPAEIAPILNQKL